MNKVKYAMIVLFAIILLFVIPSISNGAVDVSRNIYSNNWSMKFSFTGLELDTTHEYEYTLTKTAVATPEKWFSITDYTNSTAVADVTTTAAELRNVINAVDTGYITIRDKESQTVVLQPYAVDLKIPFLKVTNYTVIPNGYVFDGMLGDNNIEVTLVGRRGAYYQYEKITDENIINKYKEIKAKNGDYMELQSILKTTAPNSGWSEWDHWSGGSDGWGYTQREVSVPDSGLYYMWVYFSESNLKNIYGYILVDNLQPSISLEGVTLPKTATVQLGKTLTLSPTFNPANATNKIVTWSSSDETVATVDNAGKITPKKIGSTIITVTTQDGNKTASCTVTVTEASKNNDDNSATTGDGSTAGGNTGKGTTITKLPYAGLGIGIGIFAITLLCGGIIAYYKYRNLKDI